jgi:mannose-1-phosphate guanylyltransferase
MNGRWAIILAGGDGSRLLPLTRTLTGDERPKQFCRVLGGETLLDQTRRRIEASAEPMRSMFVLNRKHEVFYRDPLLDVPRSHMIVQPANMGTTPAILYSLMRLESHDPGAVAAFFPSDHYFSDDSAFLDHVDTAFESVGLYPELVFLLGIRPDGAEPEYGWIEPGVFGGYRDFKRVRRFWEKPSPELAQDLMDRGCLWNSFVMVGKLSSFLRLVRLTRPWLFSRFAAARWSFGSEYEERMIDKLYDEISPSNFSKDVLAPRTEDLGVIPLGSGIRWSDLGTMPRVASTLTSLKGVSPVTFPADGVRVGAI